MKSMNLYYKLIKSMTLVTGLLSTTMAECEKCFCGKRNAVREGLCISCICKKNRTLKLRQLEKEIAEKDKKGKEVSTSMQLKQPQNELHQIPTAEKKAKCKEECGKNGFVCFMCGEKAVLQEEEICTDCQQLMEYTRSQKKEPSIKQQTDGIEVFTEKLIRNKFGKDFVTACINRGDKIKGLSEITDNSYLSMAKTALNNANCIISRGNKLLKNAKDKKIWLKKNERKDFTEEAMHIESYFYMTDLFLERYYLSQEIRVTNAYVADDCFVSLYMLTYDDLVNEEALGYNFSDLRITKDDYECKRKELQEFMRFMHSRIEHLKSFCKPDDKIDDLISCFQNLQDFLPLFSDRDDGMRLCGSLFFLLFRAAKTNKQACFDFDSSSNTNNVEKQGCFYLDSSGGFAYNNSSNGSVSGAAKVNKYFILKYLEPLYFEFYEKISPREDLVALIQFLDRLSIAPCFNPEQINYILSFLNDFAKRVDFSVSF